MQSFSQYLENHDMSRINYLRMKQQIPHDIPEDAYWEKIIKDFRADTGLNTDENELKTIMQWLLFQRAKNQKAHF